MEKVQRWLEAVYEERLEKNYDAAVLVVGSEGVGKSTLILELMGRFQQIRGLDPDPESVLEPIVWNNRPEFKDAISQRPTQSAIAVPDAARVLHKKQSMAGDQVEIEQDLLDVRTKEFLMQFGYQDWGVIASILQERRAHFCLRIPERGVVEGYSRKKLDEKNESMMRDEWPEPTFVDSFPDLSGTDVWEQYTETDLEMKNQRMEADQQQDPEDAEKAAQRRTAIRAYYKIPDMTYRSISRMVDYSETWVGNTINDWEDGEIDPFDDEDPNVPFA